MQGYGLVTDSQHTIAASSFGRHSITQHGTEEMTFCSIECLYSANFLSHTRLGQLGISDAYDSICESLRALLCFALLIRTMPPTSAWRFL